MLQENKDIKALGKKIHILKAAYKRTKVFH